MEQSHQNLKALALIFHYYQVSFDKEKIFHEFNLNSKETISEVDLKKVASYLGFRLRKKEQDIFTLSSKFLPVIAYFKNGDVVVIAKIVNNEILYHKVSEQKNEKEPVGSFKEKFSGKVLLVGQKRSSEKSRIFNIKWFLPVLWKYRSLFRDVLVASFFLQIFALITPIFFQVITDKVLVHHSLETLNILIIALLSLSAFEVVLGTLRTYVFSHTTSRVDVQLGAKLFHHLLKLPLAYFTNRQVGTTVARVRELDTLRNIITGSALTVIIDSFFTIVFFAVMFYYSPLLAGVAAASVPFYILLSLFVTPVLKERLDDKFQKGALSQSFLVESIGGVETIKSMAVEPQMKRGVGEKASFLCFFILQSNEFR